MSDDEVVASYVPPRYLLLFFRSFMLHLPVSFSIIFCVILCHFQSFFVIFHNKILSFFVISKHLKDKLLICMFHISLKTNLWFSLCHFLSFSCQFVLMMTLCHSLSSCKYIITHICHHAIVSSCKYVITQVSDHVSM